MDGKHVARRRLPRPVLPVAAAFVVAAAAAGTVSFTLTGNDSTPEHDTTVAAGSAHHDRIAMDDRASRSKKRTKATTSPTPSKSTQSDATDSTGTQSASVGQTGTCNAGYVATGTTTASGQKFNPKAAAGANMTLPFGTKVRITNDQTGKSVVIRINDRGPYSSNRCFDLTSSAYQQIASLTDRQVTIDYEVLS